MCMGNYYAYYVARWTTNPALPFPAISKLFLHYSLRICRENYPFMYFGKPCLNKDLFKVRLGTWLETHGNIHAKDPAVQSDCRIGRGIFHIGSYIYARVEDYISLFRSTPHF